MATYKGIQGYSVQTLASDPSPAASVEGQLWFNSTSSTYKIAMAGAGAWASSNPRNTVVQGSPGAGSQTAAIAAGGNQVSGGLTANTETYNGTSWTEVGNLPSAIYNNSITGTTTAALMFGGQIVPALAATTQTTAWDGTSWAIVNSLLVAMSGMSKNIGIQTASLSVGGATTSPRPATNEEYNGTSWSEEADINTGRNGAGASGTATAGLIFGGNIGPAYVGNTETWDGSTWTEVNNLNTSRVGGGSAMQASNTTSLYFGGNPPSGVTAATEQYDGTSWTEVGDIAVARAECGGAGTGSAGLYFGGIVAGTPTISGVTEEWNSPVYSVKTVTVS